MIHVQLYEDRDRRSFSSSGVECLLVWSKIPKGRFPIRGAVRCPRILAPHMIRPTA